MKMTFFADKANLLFLSDVIVSSSRSMFSNRTRLMEFSLSFIVILSIVMGLIVVLHQ